MAERKERSRRRAKTPAAQMTRRHRLRRGLLRAGVHLLVWGVVAVSYYMIFSLAFDTGPELRLRRSSYHAEREYEALEARYDSLVAVLENVAERDKNVFRTLFESDPPDFGAEGQYDTWRSRERLSGMSNRALAEAFFARLEGYGSDLDNLERIYERVALHSARLGDRVHRIPSIQPIVNDDLTLLTASFGLRIHPFLRTPKPHGGVDYTVPEGTFVFATADGVVRDVTTRGTESGRSVVIDHGEGYRTTYSHLSEARVRQGQTVRRGDVIALSGNSGLSLAPHLHYEVRHNDMRVDPIHYFFMELTPDRYRRIVRIAGSGMQSFD
ncbi:MAG: M23 family metallopeptidase [Alistipes sp.]|jgi:murein DD-endopeptidase MepM/ murein hydrolase activator NlpD|nr:M23 family metallopeptidase [Alistipes sp.]